MDCLKTAHIGTGPNQGRAAPADLAHQAFGVGQGSAPCWKPGLGCAADAAAARQAIIAQIGLNCVQWSA